MRVDFVKEQVEIEATLTFRQTGILQEALQVAYGAIVTDPSGSNTAEAIQDLEDLASTIGLSIDTSVEGIEQNTV